MNTLGSYGFMNLSSMNGGIKDWIIAGYPLE
jgi:3-mercaptopyruvate sulfurtransferase SseA